jgi:AcrR family transcriptional regulator
MPRAFKPEEKDAIQSALLNAGRHLFSRYGLRRTTVKELTQAAGIAQGSFYAFYSSKEDLFFEILESEEHELFSQSIAELESEPLTRKRLKEILISGFERFRIHPFLGNLFASGEYEQLRRGIPEDRMRLHVESETRLVAEVIQALGNKGETRTIEAKLLVGLLEAFFLLFVKQEEFAPEAFHQMIDLLAGLVADHVATTGARNHPT